MKPGNKTKNLPRLAAIYDHVGIYLPGLLLLVVAGGVLWVFTARSDHRVALHLHSTQTVSGLLFIGMAVLMLNGTLAEFNSLIPPDLAIWFSDLEEQLIGLFT